MTGPGHKIDVERVVDLKRSTKNDRYNSSSIYQFSKIPLPKSNIDTKYDGLENVYPFKNGYFGCLC